MEESFSQITCVHKFKLRIPMLDVNINLKGNAMNESFSYFHCIFFTCAKYMKKMANIKIKEKKTSFFCS